MPSIKKTAAQLQEEKKRKNVKQSEKSVKTTKSPVAPAVGKAKPPAPTKGKGQKDSDSDVQLLLSGQSTPQTTPAKKKTRHTLQEVEELLKGPTTVAANLNDAFEEAAKDTPTGRPTP